MTTERQDELAQARRAKRRKIRRKRLSVLLGVVGALLLALIAASYYSDTIFYDFRDFFRTTLSIGSWPAALEEGNVKEYAVCGRSVALLSDAKLTVLSGSGARLQCVEHGVANAGLAAAGDRILVYSRAGKSYRIYDRSFLLTSGTADGAIVSAAVSASGKVALLTESAEYACALQVFAKNAELRFTWYGSSGFPLGVFASPSGDTAAVVTVSSADGRLCSTVTLIDLSAQKERARFTVEGLVLDAIPDADSAVLLLEDRAVRCLSDGTEAASYDYGGRPVLALCHAGGGDIAIALGDNNRSEMNAVAVLTKKLAVVCELDYRQQIEGMWLDGDRLHLLTGSSLYSYSHAGALRESYDADASAYAVADLGGPILITPQSAQKLTKTRKENAA